MFKTARMTNSGGIYTVCSGLSFCLYKYEKYGKYGINSSSSNSFYLEQVVEMKERITTYSGDNVFLVRLCVWGAF